MGSHPSLIRPGRQGGTDPCGRAFGLRDCRWGRRQLPAGVTSGRPAGCPAGHSHVGQSVFCAM